MKAFLALITAAAALGAAGCSKEPAQAAGGSGSPAAAASAGGSSSLPVLGDAPAWELKGVDGQPVRFDAFKGKVVVVDFWATWCLPCVEEIPGYVELQEKYGPQGLAIVGLSLDQAGPSVVKRFMEAKKVNYTIAMADDAVMEAFGGVEAIPMTFLIDRAGKIRHKKVGSMERAEYEELLAPFFR